MGIILKHLGSHRIIFYLKGADSIMMKKVPEKYKPVIEEGCEDLAKEGLRTLVLT